MQPAFASEAQEPADAGDHVRSAGCRSARMGLVSLPSAGDQSENQRSSSYVALVQMGVT